MTAEIAEITHRVALPAVLETVLDTLSTLHGPPAPQMEPVEAQRLPQPYRDLLAHDADMTSTLEAHHGAPPRLQPLAWRQRGERLEREVLLVVGEVPVEYGAIRIHLDAFSIAARRDILAGERPLGALLAAHEVDYRSRPEAYFRLVATPRIAASLDVAAGATLWGRANRLSTRGAGGVTLATVLEILPS